MILYEEYGILSMNYNLWFQNFRIFELSVLIDSYGNENIIKKIRQKLSVLLYKKIFQVFLVCQVGNSNE